MLHRLRSDGTVKAQNFAGIRSTQLAGADTDHNPKETPFLEIYLADGVSLRPGVVREGDGSHSLIDPWGNRFMVVLDYDDDQHVEVPGVGKIQEKVAVWSYGPPQDPDQPASAKLNHPEKYLTSWSD